MNKYELLFKILANVTAHYEVGGLEMTMSQNGVGFTLPRGDVHYTFEFSDDTMFVTVEEFIGAPSFGWAATTREFTHAQALKMIGMGICVITHITKILT